MGTSERLAVVGRGLPSRPTADPLPMTSPGDRVERDADALAGGTTSRRHAARTSLRPSGVLPATAGRPLDSGVRRQVEGVFSHDFSRVRVHAGEEASALADRAQARAYAVGHDIVLGRGESPAPTPLLRHELAHVVQYDATGRLVVAREPKKGAAPAPATPAAPAPVAGNFTPEETALLAEARATLKPQGSAIVGVLVPEGGQPVPIQSGGGQGFSSHVEGKATAIMRERGITKAKLLVELEPCQICDRSTYAGPDVPKEGVPSTSTGKSLSLQTSKINTALPRGSKLTVVGPQSTGHYEGVAPLTGPRAVPVPSDDPHADADAEAKAKPEKRAKPRPARKATPPGSKTPGPAPTPAPKPATTPQPAADPVVAPKVTPAPVVVPEAAPAPAAKAPVAPRVAPTPSVRPSPWKSGVKAGGQALAFMIVFAGLDYLAIKALEENLEKSLQDVRDGARPWGERMKAKNPDKPLYLKLTIGFEDHQKFIPLLGWMPDRKLHLLGMAWATEPIDPPVVEVKEFLDFTRAGKTVRTTYTELYIP